MGFFCVSFPRKVCQMEESHRKNVSKYIEIYVLFMLRPEKLRDKTNLGHPRSGPKRIYRKGPMDHSVAALIAVIATIGSRRTCDTMLENTTFNNQFVGFCKIYPLLIQIRCRTSPCLIGKSCVHEGSID